MRKVNPPKLAQFLLRKIIAESICDEVLGDMDELFERRVVKKGPLVAKIHYYQDTLFSIRNFKLRRKYQRQNPFTMYRNYLKIAYRNILKHKFYTFANTISLSIGLASVMLITLFVQQELSYDNFHDKGGRIYRLNKVVNRDGNLTKNAESAGLFGPAMADEFSEVASVTRVSQRNRTTLIYNQASIKVNTLKYVDANFFEVFDFELLRGNKSNVLIAPSTAVLTERIATALFGNEDPIGKVFIGPRGLNYTVSGITANVPKNSHIQFDMLMSWETTVPGRGPLEIGWMNSMTTQALATYVLLAPLSRPESVNEKLPAFEVAKIPDSAERYDFYLQPFEQVYLGSADIQFSPAMSGTKFLYVLASVALVILLIAIFNYVNISTSKAASRAKEIGVRKVVGAVKGQIVSQHLIESFLMVLLASIIGVFLVSAALPSFNAFTGRTLATTDVSTMLLAIVVGLILLISLISGIYPALIMSGFKPVQVLKGSTSSESFGNGPRQLLITFQFVITIIMIASTILISKQTSYMNSKDLGYNQENVLMAEFSDAIYENPEPFMNELIRHKVIGDYALSEQTPKHSNSSNGYFPDGLAEREIEARNFEIDERFIDFYEMRMLKGRNFDKSISSDINAVIINKTMQNMIGWDDPIGRQLSFEENGPLKTVIGLVEDFNFRSLHSEVEPIVMQITQQPYSLALKVNQGNLSEVISVLESTWKAFEEREPLVYSLLEDDLAVRYESENNVFKVILIFSVISILISCFGLYGLTRFTVQQKFKEIGIRKVLGAKERTVIYLINRKFGITLIIALFVALPLTYLMMNQWLQGFAYRINLGVMPFVTAVMLTLAITALTISIQTIRAARANPADALRAE